MSAVERHNPGTSGIGLAPILFVVFLVLKLTHVIDWSWWWVTAPLWAATAVFLVVSFAVLLGAAFIPGSKRIILLVYRKITTRDRRV